MPPQCGLECGREARPLRKFIIQHSAFPPRYTKTVFNACKGQFCWIDMVYSKGGLARIMNAEL